MKKKKLIIFIVALGLITLANVFDIVSDLSESVTAVHLIEEVLAMVFSVSLMIYLIIQLRKQHEELEGLKQQIEKSRELLDKQSHELKTARSEYSQLIKQQFEDWRFTRSETETAYLLLKGLSFKEIAEVRDIKEKTVRQQASNLYSKAELPGRHALAAWFFEELL
jgi:DNA-binding NarL/FixJ family response regulator